MGLASEAHAKHTKAFLQVGYCVNWKKIVVGNG